MEETREPQPPAVAPIAYQPQPAYLVPQQSAYAPAPKAGRFTRFRRLVRLLLHRLLYGSLIVGRALRPYAAFILIIIALAGVIGWMGYLLWRPTAPAAAFSRAESIPPASAVETFIQGQQNYNADMMWDAYSANYQASQLANGASKATLQAQANDQRSRGWQFTNYDYIGGVQADDGSMYFYSVDLKVMNQQVRVPIVFRADADGKIIGIQSPLTSATSASQ